MRAVLVLPLLPLALLAACDGAARAGEAQGGAADINGTRGFALAGFDRVSLRGPDDVVVAIGPRFAVSARGPRAVLDRLQIAVSGGTLEVGRKRGAWGIDVGSGHATVTVTLPALAGADVAGSGDMRVGALRGASFNATVAGSGNLALDGLAVDKAMLTVAGSGDLDAVGTTRRGAYAIAGSGNLRAGRLAADSVSVNVAGSGDMSASARAAATISLVGSGDVTVTGGAHCTVSRLGSGNVRCG